MKKIIMTSLLLITAMRSFAQTSDKSQLGIGITSGIAGSALVAGYFLSCNKTFNNIKTADGQITDQQRHEIHKANAPYLFVAGGCYLLTMAAICEYANVSIHFKHTKATAGIMGAGIGINMSLK